LRTERKKEKKMGSCLSKVSQATGGKVGGKNNFQGQGRTLGGTPIPSAQAAPRTPSAPLPAGITSAQAQTLADTDDGNNGNDNTGTGNGGGGPVSAAGKAAQVCLFVFYLFFFFFYSPKGFFFV
jgi:hypothetical protein